MKKNNVFVFVFVIQPICRPDESVFDNIEKKEIYLTVLRNNYSNKHFQVFSFLSTKWFRTIKSDKACTHIQKTNYFLSTSLLLPFLLFMTTTQTVSCKLMFLIYLRMQSEMSRQTGRRGTHVNCWTILSHIVFFTQIYAMGNGFFPNRSIYIKS